MFNDLYLSPHVGVIIKWKFLPIQFVWNVEDRVTKNCTENTPVEQYS